MVLDLSAKDPSASDSGRRQQQPRRAADLLILLSISAALAVLISISFYRLYFAHPGNDQAWLLYAAGQMLHGEVLYGSRVIETNPPLIIWFSILPVLLGRWLHLDWLLVLRAVVSAMLLGSVLWCLRILRTVRLARGTVMGWLWGLALFAAEISQHGNDFGQKEQLLIILLLPFLIYGVVEGSPGLSSAALSTAGPDTLLGTAGLGTAGLGTAERLALGGAAGIGICLKPQDGLALAAFEIFLLLATRNWRRLFRLDLLAVVATGLVYPLTVWLFTPLYLTRIVPLLRDTYWAFGEYTTLEVLRNRGGFNILCLLTLLGWFVLRKRLRYPLAPLALLASSLGAALAFALQNKDWPYQFFPQQALLCCALAWLVLEAVTASARQALARAPHAHRRVLLGTVLLTAVLLPEVLHVGSHHNSLVSQTPDSEFLDGVLARCPPGTPVMMLSIDLMGTSDILQDHLREGSRYHHLWMLPAIVLNEMAEAGGPPARRPIAPARLRQLEQLQRADVAADLRTRQPAVVLVPRCKSTPDEPCQGLYGKSFDILAWFLQSPDFAAAWAPYRHLAGDDDFDAYARTRSPAAPRE